MIVADDSVVHEIAGIGNCEIRSLAVIRMRNRLQWCVVACASLLLTWPCLADPPDSTAIERLLAEAWQTTPDAKSLADQLYRANIGKENDPQLHFAYILTLIKQRRHSDALLNVREFVASYPDDVNGRWTETWLLLAKRDHSAALSRLGSLADLIQQEVVNGIDPLPQPKRSLLVELTGQAIGYLEGPVRGRVNDLDLDRSIARITGALNDVQLVSFQNARSAIQTEFEDRQRQIRQTAFEQQQQRDNQRVVMQATLQQQQTDLSRRKESVERSKQQVDSAFLDRRAALDEQELSIGTDVAELTNQVRNQRSELFLVGAQIAQLDAVIQTEPDPVRRAILIAQINDLIRIQRFQLADLRIAESNLSGAQTIHAQTRQRQWSAQQQYQQEYDQIDKSNNVLVKQERKVQRQFLDLAEPDQRSPTQVRALQKRAASLTTYLPFPLEHFRQDVLKGIRP